MFDAEALLWSNIVGWCGDGSAPKLLILFSAKAVEVVLDPFAGSGASNCPVLLDCCYFGWLRFWLEVAELLCYWQFHSADGTQALVHQMQQALVLRLWLSSL
ncbi:hypothetical protein Nepgr_022791 [Nepenthes gracilis]|uniref:Uncharacterized protein n=1 Tax=Nepenthes gracilis TaxID=150966 RepID=A0AAD3T1F8_NEPGR|nr:hypothetical protein Nepgr_022791 [Nepenthes gracilis]